MSHPLDRPVWSSLTGPQAALALADRGARRYAPDYAINAGGLVNVAEEVKGCDAKRARERTMKIYDTIFEICDRSKTLQLPTYRVADTIVEERLGKAATSR